MTGEFGPPKFLVYFALLYASPRFPVVGFPGEDAMESGRLCESMELGVAVGGTKIVVVRVVSTEIVEKIVDCVEFALMEPFIAEYP